MKYFTPDLIKRFQYDDASFDATDEEWERNNDKYVQELESMNLSENVRAFLDLDLHDVPVLAILDDDTSLSIIFNVIGKLEYSLTNCPSYQQHESMSMANPFQWWYDEISEDTHSILFSNGLEITIPFSDIKWVPNGNL